MRSRKGFIGDAAYVVGLLFLLTLVIFVSYSVMSDFNDQFQEDARYNASANTSSVLTSRFVNLWDGIFVFVFGGLTVALLVSVALLGSRPEFFFITIIISFLMVGGAALFGNIYESISGNAILATSASSFSYIPIIMDNLVNISLFLIIALMVGLFVKARGVI